MAPMAQRSSGSSRHGSGGDGGRRGKRKPSGSPPALWRIRLSWWSREDAGGAFCRPHANPRSVGMWERAVAAVNHVFHAPDPFPFYIARATGAHQPYGLDAPDQSMFKGSGLIFGSGPWRSTPTST